MLSGQLAIGFFISAVCCVLKMLHTVLKFANRNSLAISKFLERHSKAKRIAPAYSR